SKRANASCRFALPSRSDFTSVPWSTSPASSVSRTWYSWRARRLRTAIFRPSSPGPLELDMIGGGSSAGCLVDDHRRAHLHLVVEAARGFVGHADAPVGDGLPEEIRVVGAVHGDVLLQVHRRGPEHPHLEAPRGIERRDRLAALDEGPVGDAPDGGLLLELDAEHPPRRGEVPLLPRPLAPPAGAGAHHRRPDHALLLHQVEAVLLEGDHHVASLHVDGRVAVAGEPLPFHPVADGERRARDPLRARRPRVKRRQDARGEREPESVHGHSSSSLCLRRIRFSSYTFPTSPPTTNTTAE